jgi:hypothetical protein
MGNHGAAEIRDVDPRAGYFNSFPVKRTLPRLRYPVFQAS